MLRKVFTVVSAVSLVLAMGAAVLWVQGTRQVLYASGVIFGRRYGVSCDRQGVIIHRPPRSNASAQLSTIISNLNNDQLAWEADFQRYGNGYLGIDSPRIRSGTPADQVFGNGQPPTDWLKAGAMPLLLDALDDPRRFVVAHVLLARRSAFSRVRASNEWEASFKWSRPDLDGGGSYDHLAVRLHIDRVPKPPDGIESRPDRQVEYVARIDPSQMGAIREQWHLRLDKKLGGIRYTEAVGLLLILPVSWACLAVYRMFRSDRRLRRKLCIACGYNLTGNISGVCPECGAAVARATPAKPPGA